MNGIQIENIKNKTLILYDDMIAYMLSNKKLQSIIAII